MLLNLIHHLVGFDILVDSMVIGQAFVTQGKETVNELTDYRKTFRICVEVVRCPVRVLLFDDDLELIGTLRFSSIAQRRSSLDHLNSSLRIFSIL